MNIASMSTRLGAKVGPGCMQARLLRPVCSTRALRVACQAGARNSSGKSKLKSGQPKREDVVKGDVGPATDRQLKKSEDAPLRPASADDPGAPDVPITFTADELATGARRNSGLSQADAWQEAAPLAPGSSNDPDDREVPIDTGIDATPSAGPLAEARRSPAVSLGGTPREGTTRSSASDEALAELAEARAQAAAATAPPQEGDGPAEAAGDAAEQVDGALDQGADAVAGAADRVQEYADDPARAVGDAADAASRAVGAAAGGARQAVRDNRGRVDEGADAVAGPSAAENVDDAAKQLEGGIGGATKQAQGGIQDVGRRLQSAVEDPFTAIEDLSQQVTRTAEQSTAQAREGLERMADEVQRGGPAAPFAATPLTSLPSTPGEGVDQVEYAKLRLMYCVAGLDRGFAANKAAVSEVAAVVNALVAAGATVDFQGEGGSMDQLYGNWRLLYSSAFARGGLESSRLGPPPALIPFKLGQVYQTISEGRLNNVVELYGRYNLPALPGVNVEPIVATATLKHMLRVSGVRRLEITFEDTELKATGGVGGILGRLPELTLPQLPEPFRPQARMRSSSFEVIFLDAGLRITRGDRGELRVFTRA